MKDVLNTTLDMVDPVNNADNDEGLSRYQALIGHHVLEFFQNYVSLHPSVNEIMRKHFIEIFSNPPLPKLVLVLSRQQPVTKFHSGFLRLVVDLVKKDLDYWWKHQGNWKTYLKHEYPLVALFFGNSF